MSHTTAHPAVPLPAQDLPSEVSSGLQNELALPFFVFAAILVSLLSISLVIVLPALTQVAVNGQPRDLAGLRSTREQMLAELQRREQERDRGVLTDADPAYEALKRARGDLPVLPSLREQLLHLAGSLVSEKDAVHIGSVRLTWEREKALAVGGDVRNVGPRSMTVLAQFTEELRRLPFVASVTPSLYQRLEDDHGMHSPFQIILTLR